MTAWSAEPRVVVVMLRQPDSSNVEEKRTDPLYEFGSFGLTGCHRGNVLANTHATGARLAFAQGGPNEVRLVMLTSSITVVRHAMVLEATWGPAEMPLRFRSAPLLIDNDGNSDVPLLRAAIEVGQRPTWVSRFASAFRGRTRPLDCDVAHELVSVWEQHASVEARARFYWEALPFPPPVQDRDREESRADLLRAAGSQVLVRECSPAGQTGGCRRAIPPPVPAPPSAPSCGSRRPRRTC